MVLPGWNVSEPLELAVKLYEVVEALKSAPEEAKAFRSKIDSFRRSLTELQKVIHDDVSTRSSAQDLDHLRETLLECQDCVKRCEEFGGKFGKIAKDGAASLRGAREATRFVWQDKKVARLRQEIDSQMNGIGLTLMIKTFSDSRSRRGSEAPSAIGFSPPRRTDTNTTLPPYTPGPGIDWNAGETPRAKTPAEILGLKVDTGGEKSESDVKFGKSKALLESDEVPSGKIFASPQSSPTALRPKRSSPELDKDVDVKPLPTRQNTATEVATPPDALGIYGSYSSSSYSTSPTLSRVFSSPAGFSVAPSRQTSHGDTISSLSRQDSFFSLDSALPEMSMYNLTGAKISYYKSKSRISYPVTSIESFRDSQTRRRFIIISPPSSSNIKLYLFPPSERLIPHSEHPQAYGSTNRYRVKFIEPYRLSSQRVSPSGKQPEGGLSIATPPTAASSASVSSFSGMVSPTLSSKESAFKEESRRHEYDFEREDDYQAFQELLMGPDVKLHLQVPIQLITSKRYEEGKLVKHSELQYLRLWQYGRSQHLMFFANLSSNKYKEYKLDYFQPIDAKSKTVVKLNVHMPGMVRRGSKSKSPVLYAEQAPEVGLVGGTDFEDLKGLDYMSIEFSHAEDKTSFLRQAKFHGLPEDAMISPITFQSRSPTV